MWKKLFGNFLAGGGEQPNEDQPVHNAARESARELALLLDHTPRQRDQPGWYGRQPIHVAAEAGRTDCVDLLLDRGASPNAREGLHMQTPLHHAVTADSYECVDRLLRARADVNAADNRGETPIFYAKSLRVIERLAAAGADLNIISGRGQYPFQYCAAYIRSFDVMNVWVERGVPINHVPTFGWPALHAVCAMVPNPGEPHDETPAIRIIELLLAYGADIDLTDKEGNTALFHCCMNRKQSLAEVLLKADADPNVRNRAGETALHAAVFRGDERLVRLLLNHGAEVRLANRHRKTPYDISEDGSAIRDLLAPFNQPAEYPVPTAEAVIQRLRSMPKFRSAALRGCTEAEITRLEEHFRVRLPAAYREFLRRMGKGAGEFMQSDHWRFQLDDLFSIARDPGYAELCDLPDDYFAFAERNGCAWVFFVADGKSDDPSVSLFDDGDDRSYRQVARSVWEFVESLVIDYEIWYGSEEKHS